jgi:NitT/TauT family transport system substrate-binding protein
MKKLLSILLACTLVLSLAACRTNAPAPTVSPTVTAGPSKEAKTYTPATVRVAYMPNMGSASSLLTAIKKGYFNEVGLTVKLTQFQGGPAEIAAMASGDIDISQIGHGAHALAIEGQAKVFAFDNLSIADEVIANKDKGITKASDLKGKTIASTAGTSAEIILSLVLSKAGLTTKDVNIVEMDANGIVSAMIGGKVDACATWDPGTIKIKETLGNKALVLGNNKDFIDTVTFPSSFITTEKYAKDNEDVVVRFGQAILKAQDYRAKHLEEVAGWLATEIEADKALILKSVNTGTWPTGEFIQGALADGTIKGYYKSQQKVFIDIGRIKSEVPVENYVMFDIMNKAVNAYKESK